MGSSIGGIAIKPDTSKIDLLKVVKDVLGNNFANNLLLLLRSIKKIITIYLMSFILIPMLTIPLSLYSIEIKTDQDLELTL